MNSNRLTLRKIFYFPIWVGYWILQVVLGAMLWPAFYGLDKMFEEAAPTVRIFSATTVGFIALVSSLPAKNSVVTFQPNILTWNSLAFIAFLLGFGIWTLYEKHYTERFYGDE